MTTVSSVTDGTFSILREEGEADVFEVRRWSGGSSDSGDSSMDEFDEDNEDESEIEYV